MNHVNRSSPSPSLSSFVFRLVHYLVYVLYLDHIKVIYILQLIVPSLVPDNCRLRWPKTNLSELVIDSFMLSSACKRVFKRFLLFSLQIHSKNSSEFMRVILIFSKMSLMRRRSEKVFPIWYARWTMRKLFEVTNLYMCVFETMMMVIMIVMIKREI